MNYKDYKERLLNLLIEEAQKATGKKWEDDGLWAPKNVRRSHILPLPGDNNSVINRANAIREYMGFDCAPYFDKDFNGLHINAHHINSSQITCLMFFSKLIDKDGHARREMVEFMKKAFGIDIHIGAKCDFEYTEKFCPYDFDVDKDGNRINGYEGTSFDFHIKDENIEVYFEIKLTEQGFHKETEYKKGIENKRHKAKAQIYFEICPQLFKDRATSPVDFLAEYQIYRNIIRAKDGNFVIFITDENNQATNRDVGKVRQLQFPKNVIFETWQKLIKIYHDKLHLELPFQLKAVNRF